MRYTPMDGGVMRQRPLTPITESWLLTTQDVDNQPKSLRLDITDDEAPIKIGMDVKSHSITDNISCPNKLIIQRPSDKTARTLTTYLYGETVLNKRQRVLVAPITPSSTGIIEKYSPLQPVWAISLDKRINNATHESRGKIIQVCKDAGWTGKTGRRDTWHVWKMKRVREDWITGPITENLTEKSHQKFQWWNPGGLSIHQNQRNDLQCNSHLRCRYCLLRRHRG